MSIWRGVSSDKVQGECKLKFSGEIIYGLSEVAMLFNKKKKYKALKDYCLKKDKHPSIKKVRNGL